MRVERGKPKRLSVIMTGCEVTYAIVVGVEDCVKSECRCVTYLI